MWTKGPWVASQYLDNEEWGVITAPANSSICSEEGGGEIIVGTASRITEANAKLIAAAPALYEALNTAIGLWGNCGCKDCAAVYDAGKVALARADGK